jgi:hypothetical protein
VAGLGCDAVGPGHEQWSPPPGAAVAVDTTREPCAHRSERKRAFFGDLHVHTRYSMDARSWDLVLGPDDAYRYARGEPTELVYAGGTVALSIDRPLDFAAVTDHAEWMGEVARCITPGSPVYDAAGCQAFRGERVSWLARVLRLEGMAARMAGLAGLRRRARGVCGEGAAGCRESLHDAWQETRAAAERWYDRSSACRFTTFQAWEYSASPNRSKVHRNVILASAAAPELPISWIDTPTASGLRRKLRELCIDTASGCDAIAIPHNPNLSNGRMFAWPEAGIDPTDERGEAALRAALEPVVEMMQVKGESECAPGAADELCGFEKIRHLPSEPEDCGDGVGHGGAVGRGCTAARDFVREALTDGLRQWQRIGVNPFGFGLIGSTDTHTATPGGVAEDAFAGSTGPRSATPIARLTLGDRIAADQAVWRNPGGLVGIFAEENSRPALFAALKRREVFATSGPRIEPRLAAGFALPPDACERGIAQQAEGYGVPMGGELGAAPGAQAAPTFVVSALRDPGRVGHPGGLLERIQIVKGWVDGHGAAHHRVVDVAGGPASDAGVDLATCEPYGSGATQLCGSWTDPDFDVALPAVYYARVLENPSCRWTTWQCNALPDAERPDGCRDPRVPKTIQERAWTSPVWYLPAS